MWRKTEAIEGSIGGIQPIPKYGPFSLIDSNIFRLYRSLMRRSFPGFYNYYAAEVADIYTFMPHKLKNLSINGVEQENFHMEIWQNIAMQVHRKRKEDGVLESGYGVELHENSLTILLQAAVGEYVTSHGQSVSEVELGEIVSTCKRAVDERWSPLQVQTQKDSNRSVKSDTYVFKSRKAASDPAMYYFLLASYIVRENHGISGLLTKLSAEGMFEDGSQLLYYQFYSLLAQSIFRNAAGTGETDEMKNNTQALEDLLMGITENYTAYEGFVLSALLIEELETQVNDLDLYKLATRDYFRPAETGSAMQRRLLEKVYLERVKNNLAEKYFSFAYKKREEIIPASARTVSSDYMAAGRPDACFDEIFKSSGPLKSLRAIPLSTDKKKNEALIKAVEAGRKEEAGIIPLFADILGYDPEITAKFAAYIAVLWRHGIVSMDNAIDLHTMRDGLRTDVVTRGRADAIEIPLSRMFNIVKGLMRSHNATHPGLVEAAIAMLDDVYEGDLHTRELGWDDEYPVKIHLYDIEEYKKELKKIAHILSWFPQVAGLEVGLDDVGLALAHAAENIGRLVLVNNDFEELATESLKHEGGNDIGQKLSLPLWAFIRLAAKEGSEIIKGEGEFVIKYILDIRLKRLSGEVLTPDNRRKIDYITKTVRNHLPAIMVELEPHVAEFYNGGKEALAKARKALTDRSIQDDRNQQLLAILDKYLDSLYFKIHGYGQRI